MKKILFLLLILLSTIAISAQDAITVDANGNVLFKLIDKTIPVNLGASQPEPFDLSVYAVEEKLGFRFRVSWFDGDGTNQFTFADSTPSYTIDNIASAEWVGQGIGHLDLVYDGEDNFEVINAGEVWDTLIWGNKTSQKFLNGSKMDSAFGEHILGNAAVTFLSNFSNTNFAITAMPTNSGTIRIVSAGSKTENGFTIYLWGTNSASGSGYVDWEAKGRWTTQYPRKS